MDILLHYIKRFIATDMYQSTDHVVWIIAIDNPYPCPIFA